MKLLNAVILLIVLLRPAALRSAEAANAIEGELTAQAQAWNAGDIPAFMRSYAEDCIFVGKQVLHGKAALRDRYEKAYSSRAAMGKLTFSNLNIRPLDGNVAVVTGEWRLERSPAAGGVAGGVFSLVWQLKDARWQIVLDHTT
ncbi:MAG: nuclear transport factor 2 family protein [Acidobacteriaceae bacterium]|nr:nuclear transport factor 2 family protein [Acidobacteriaceae bacterium]